MAKQQSFFHAVKWAYTANWGDRAFSALFGLVLAVMVGPREFGVLSIAIVYITFIQMFLDQGLVGALIQRKDLRPEHLDAVFWADLILSILLGGVSILFSNWWAEVNHLPELPSVILVLSLCIPVEALAIVQRTILKRDMDFKSLSIRSNASVLTGGLVGVGLAFAGAGVWALVVQQVVKDLVALVLLWRLSSWRPRRSFSWPRLKELLHFSGSNFVAQLGTFADLHTDTVLLGIFFGPLAVGLYRLADRLMSAVLSATTSSIQAVSLPEFSRLQDQPTELRKSVLACIRLSSLVTVPAMAGLAAISGSLMAVLGARWAPSSQVLKILCVVGVALVFSYFTGPLLQAMGRPHHLALLEWGRAVLGAALLVIAALFVRNSDVQIQILGIASARLITTVCIAMPVFVFLLLRLSDVSLIELVDIAAPSFIAAASILLAAYGLALLGSIINVTPVSALTAYLLTGLAAGTTTLLIADKQLRLLAANMFTRPARVAAPQIDICD